MTSASLLWSLHTNEALGILLGASAMATAQASDSSDEVELDFLTLLAAIRRRR